MLRFSLAALLLFVLAAGLGCTALVNASPVWSGIVFTATLVILAVFVLAACQWQGSGRAFAVGFALWGGGYLGFVLWDAGLSGNLVFGDRDGANTGWLLTEELLVQLDSEIQRTKTPWFQNASGDLGGGFGGGGSNLGGGFFAVQSSASGDEDGSFGPDDGSNAGTLAPGGMAGPGAMAPGTPGTGMIGGPTFGGLNPPVPFLVRKPEFYRIGHCLWALLLGLVGGILSRGFFAVSKRATQPTAA